MGEISKKGLGSLFFHIGTGIALAFSTVSGIRVGIGIIDRLVPSDHTSWYQLSHHSELSMSAAFLLVSFIVLVIVQRYRGDMRDHMGTVWYTLCRAILFIILTVSVGLFAVAVSLLFGELFSGAVSLNSFLRMVFVIAVGSAIFYYYRGVLYAVWHVRKKRERIFVGVVSVLVGLLVFGAVTLVNPFKQPALRVTYGKLDCLESISRTLEDYYFGHHPEGEQQDLPTTDAYHAFLKDDDLFSPHYYRTRGVRCEDMGISYELIDATHYRLCTSFTTLPEGVAVRGYPYHDFPVPEVGEHCFDRDVEK
ncbi:MAG: hypothetical protein OXB96_01990 [Candidatus Kaiserbacteria bacterium]|nr:hypothetical protein [Candidatus Kaiserbacteria bacterium]